MAMIGAQLETLDALAQQLGVTSVDIADVSAGAVRAFSDAVEALEVATASAVQNASMQTANLRASVNTSQQRSADAVWTGSNATRFHEAYQSFDGAIVGAEHATNDAFADFKRQIGDLSAALGTFIQSFQTSMTNAAASTDSMSSAVRNQRTTLDQVMNTGLTIG
jgi:hypothetical protein